MRAILLAAALLLSLPAMAAPTHCGDRAAMIEHLRKRYGERLVAVARGAGDAVLEVYASDGGATWTAVMTHDGIACVAAVGTRWSSREIADGAI